MEINGKYIILYFTVNNVILRLNLTYLFYCKRKFLPALAQTSGGSGDYVPAVFVEHLWIKTLGDQKSQRMAESFRTRISNSYLYNFICLFFFLYWLRSHFQPNLSTDGTHCSKFYILEIPTEAISASVQKFPGKDSHTQLTIPHLINYPQ